MVPRSLTKLRLSGVLYGLTCNGLLTLSTTGEFQDPQVRNLVRRLKFFRRYFRQFPDRRPGFLSRICQSDVRRTGPAYAFRQSFHDVGWQCEQEGWLQRESGLRFNWLTSSTRYMRLILTKVWESYVAGELGRRKHFDVACFSGQLFYRSLKNRTPRDQGILTTIACGKNITRDALNKYAWAATDANCPLCGQPDSKVHRIFECAGLSSLRRQYAAMFAWLRQQPDAVFAFGVAEDSFDTLLYRAQHQTEWRAPVIPADDGERHVCFTDGTCFFPTDWEFALAASSAVFGCEGHFQPSRVVREVVPGSDHSAHRGEAYAIFLALESAYRVDIFTDCSAVVTVLQTALGVLATGGAFLPSDHHDLWGLIRDRLRRRSADAVRVFKVAAHQRWQFLADPSHQGRAYMNDVADSHAKDAVLVDCSAMYHELQRRRHQQQRYFGQLVAYHDFLCAAAIYTFDEGAPVQQTVECPLPDFQDDVLTDGHAMPILFLEWFREQRGEGRAWPFPGIFAERFIERRSQLQWDSHGEVGALELYFDFAIHAASRAPVKVGHRDYRMKDQSLAADAKFLTLADQSRVWVKALRWVSTRCDCPPFILQQNKALAKYGYSVFTVGFPCHVRLLHRKSVQHELWGYFHTNRATKRDLCRPWHGPG